MFRMGGGVLVATVLVAGRSLFRRPARLAAAWVLSFATLVVAGYAIEMNEMYFGAGDPKAAGAANDAVFTWLHQDIGLFLLSTIVLVMLAVERLIKTRPQRPGVIAWTTIAGTDHVHRRARLRLCQPDALRSGIHHHHCGPGRYGHRAPGNPLVGRAWGD